MNFKESLLYLIHSYNRTITDLNNIPQQNCLIKDDFIRNNVSEYFIWFKKNYKYLEYFYRLLENYNDKQLFLKMVAYKMTVVFPSDKEHNKYLQSRKKFDGLLENDSVFKLKSATRKLKFYNLLKLGYNLKVYGVKSLLDKLITYDQYNYKEYLKKGDYVIDAGGCWGDTALLFADRVGKKGKVWTFEFFEDNIDVMIENFNHNKEVSQNITLINKPLYNKSGRILYTKKECADITALTSQKKLNSVKYKTLSIDDFMYSNKIKKIDYIKMDIEGCELRTLQGAKETLIKYKPKLAIAAYHKKEDCYKISKFLNELNIGYKFYFASYTSNFTDTVIYAL